MPTMTLTQAEIDALVAKGAKLGPLANLGKPVEDEPGPPPVYKQSLDQDGLIQAMPTAAVYIPGWHPKSLNKRLGAHWATGLKAKRAEQALVAAACIIQGAPKAVGKRRVDLHLVMRAGQRRCDADNLWKSVLDALVHAEMLVNDSPEWREQGKVMYSRSDDGMFGTLLLLRDV